MKKKILLILFMFLVCSFNVYASTNCNTIKRCFEKENIEFIGVEITVGGVEDEQTVRKLLAIRMEEYEDYFGFIAWCKYYTIKDGNGYIGIATGYVVDKSKSVLNCLGK